MGEPQKILILGRRKNTARDFKKKSQKRCIVHLSSASIIWKKIFGENSIRKMSSWTHGHDDADDDDDDML